MLCLRLAESYDLRVDPDSVAEALSPGLGCPHPLLTQKQGVEGPWDRRCLGVCLWEER